MQPLGHPLLFLVEAGLKSCGGESRAVSGARINKGESTGAERQQRTYIAYWQRSAMSRARAWEEGGVPGSVLQVLPESLQKSANWP